MCGESRRQPHPPAPARLLTFGVPCSGCRTWGGESIETKRHTAKFGPALIFLQDEYSGEIRQSVNIRRLR